MSVAGDKVGTSTAFNIEEQFVTWEVPAKGVLSVVSVCHPGSSLPFHYQDIAYLFKSQEGDSILVVGNYSHLADEGTIVLDKVSKLAANCI